WEPALKMGAVRRSPRVACCSWLATPVSPRIGVRSGHDPDEAATHALVPTDRCTGHASAGSLALEEPAPAWCDVDQVDARELDIDTPHRSQAVKTYEKRRGANLPRRSADQSPRRHKYVQPYLLT